MPRFYLDCIINVGDTINLPIEVIRHIQVLRIKKNDEISIFNGDGNSYVAQITTLERRSIIIKVISLENRSSINSLESKNFEESSTHVNLQPNIHLAMTIIANDKMDLVINSVTQLGVATITPIISKYSQKIAKDNIDKKLSHWKKISISACEQSGRNTLPQINHPTTLEDFLNHNIVYTKILLSLHQENNGFNITDLATKTHKDIAQNNPVSILVGPEGGFTLDEVKHAVKSGYKTLTLQPHVLRAEIAAISGISIIKFLSLK